MGIEPTWLAWKARALPLSYTRGCVLGCNIIVGRGFLCQVIYLSRTSLTLVDRVLGKNGLCINSNFFSLMVFWVMTASGYPEVSSIFVFG